MSINGSLTAWNDTIDFIGLAGRWFFNNESTKLQKQQLQLQKKQYALDLNSSYNSALETLAQISIDYDTAQAALRGQRQQLSSYDEAIGRFHDYYALQMATAQSQGIAQYQQGMANWQNQQVMSAERGQTGSTASLLSAMQKQSLINFVGTDLVADAEGGNYGMSLTELMRDLDAEGREAVGNRDILAEAIGINEKTANSYTDSMRNILKSTLSLGYDNNKSYSELASLVDQYRQYLGTTSDAEYNTLKSDLLRQYTPLDYRVTSYIEEWETGGESQHGATQHQATRYITWVKDKETDMWQQASSDQLKELKKIYGKNYVENYVNANEVIDVGDLRSKYSWQNGKYVLTQPKIIYQDTFQKRLEKAGSRPK